MKEKKLTQRAVAKSIGVSKQTLQDWKNHPHVKPKHENVKALSRLFSVPTGEIYAVIDAGDFKEADGFLLPEPVWRAIVDDYKQSLLGRDTPAPLVERLYRAPHADFSRRLVHELRQELDVKAPRKK